MITKPLIVGVDPGIYLGVAIFDLGQNLLSAVTITNGGKEAAVAEITKYGTPVIVAGDVSPPPEFVIHIASYFNARLVYPKSVILEKEKSEMAAQYKPKTAHERDAISAAVKFFKEQDNKMRWIERVLRDKDLSKFEQDVKRYVLSGTRIDDAIRVLTESQREYREVIAHAESIPEKPQIRLDRRKEDRDMLRGLLEANSRMRSRLSVLDEENKVLRKKITELKDGGISQHIRTLIEGKDRQIGRLRARLERSYEEAKKKDIPEKAAPEPSPEKDLKAGNEDSTLQSIVEEYRLKRQKEQSKGQF